MSEKITDLENLIHALKKENASLKVLLQNNNISCSTVEMKSKPNDKNDVTNRHCNKKQTLTPEEKIHLYRSFFKGREDVYALRWENTKTNRSGYSPACENEWHPKLCKKPKIKCGVCPNQKWKPLTDQVLYSHLSGDIFVGIYPLLGNDHCHFLAIDFDKEQWKSDVTAFSEVCNKHNVPYLLEQSQSGNGAHIWLFFDEAIPAITARNLGTALLTLVMQEYPHLSMDSYDRLFPNQDVLPKGGFGNLIALPLQGKRRLTGNSTFVNIHNNFIPFSDPWQILAEMNKLSLAETQLLVDKTQSTIGILDVDAVATEGEVAAPWEHQHQNKKIDYYPLISETIPQTIEIVKANLIYVPTQSLPPKLINCIRKIAAFQNPEFYRTQAMRLSTYGKPRVIHCAELFPEHIGLPRGCEDQLFKLLAFYQIQAAITDKRECGIEIDVTFLGKLLPLQEKAVESLLLNDIGVLSARTGFGKTVVAAHLIAARKTNTLILVHRQQLLEQWHTCLMTSLGLNKKQIGVVKSGKFKLTGQIDIAMMQSLVKQGVVANEITQYGHVIVDECHHLSAFSFEQILKHVKAKYVLGLTATPFRKDGHQPIIFMQCGPVRHQCSMQIESEFEALNLVVYTKQTAFQSSEYHGSITSLYKQLTEDQVRNHTILKDIIKAFNDGRHPLLLTSRKEHLKWFSDKLTLAGIKEVYVLKGGMRKKSRDEIMQNLSQSKSNRILLATGSYIGEGFDDPKLDTLFLALPISWHGTLQQYVGRLHRSNPQKSVITVYDYVDINLPVFLKMYQKRLKKYKSMGYTVK